MNPEDLARPFTGYIAPAQVDPRNYVLEVAQDAVPTPPAYKTDISMFPIYDQFQIPDCVENALTYIKKYHIYKTTGKVVDLCRRFLADLTAIADGFPLVKGTSLQTALNVLRHSGICETSFLPDDHQLPIETFADTSRISAVAYTNGLTHTITNYAYLSDKSAQGLRNAIFQNGMVVAVMKIDQNWWTAPNGTPSWNPADILPLRPVSNPANMSQHAVVLYGYDMQRFYLVNSFGPAWAEHGTGYFGVNDIPEIVAAATLVDFTPEQIQKVKQVIQNAPIPNPTPVKESILQEIAQILEKWLEG